MSHGLGHLDNPQQLRVTEAMGWSIEPHYLLQFAERRDFRHFGSIYYNLLHNYQPLDIAIISEATEMLYNSFERIDNLMIPSVIQNMVMKRL